MGYFSNLEIEIIDLARELGDEHGMDAETIKFISRVLDITPAEVQRVLFADHDEDPAEYSENAADEDAIYYGEA